MNDWPPLQLRSRLEYDNELRSQFSVLNADSKPLFLFIPLRDDQSIAALVFWPGAHPAAKQARHDPPGQPALSM